MQSPTPPCAKNPIFLSEPNGFFTFLSSEITNNMETTNIELEDQKKRLDKTTDTVVKILQRVPIIEQMFGKIKFH